jgi:flagellar hook-associated protein 3 FlgL
MRIGTRAFYDSVARILVQGQKDLGGMTVAMSSGKRVSVPSDDPASCLLISRARTELALCDSRRRATVQGQQLAGATEQGLQKISGDLGDAIDAARRAIGSGISDQGRAASVAEVRSAIEALVTAGNTKSGDRFIFGGYSDQARPFELSGGGVTYAGDHGQLAVNTGYGTPCPVTFAGSDVFNFDPGTGRSVPKVDADVFTVLNQLATALESGDNETAAELVDDLQLLRDHVVNLRGSIGSSALRLEAGLDALERSELRCQALLEEHETLDIADALTRYSAAETAYQALLSTITSVLQMPTLFDGLQ